MVNVEACGIEQRIRRINKNADAEIIDLLNKMLVYDPQKRISAKEALKLKMFSGYQCEAVKT